MNHFLYSLFRLTITVSSTFLLLTVYLIKKTVSGDDLTALDWLKIALYVAVPIVATGLAIWLSRWLTDDQFNPDDITSIESISQQFLPSYLSLTFVGISLTGHLPLVFVVYGTLFVFTFLSQAFYHNPFFFLFGYYFYKLSTKQGKTLLLISKQKLSNTKDVDVPYVKKINDYFYIQRGAKD